MMIAGLAFTGNSYVWAQELPLAATNYDNPRGKISLKESGYNPADKMTPTKDAISNDENASNTNPLYPGCKKTVADLCAAYERLPYCLFPYKPYYKYKQDYYFWGKSSNDLLMKQYDNFCLDLLDYPMIMKEGELRTFLGNRMWHLSDKRLMLSSWLNVEPLMSGETGVVPLIDCIHHLASSLYAANPNDDDSFAKLLIALHLSKLGGEVIMENPKQMMVDANTKCAVYENMRARTNFLLQISETHSTWAQIYGNTKFLVEEFKKINSTRDTRKPKALYHAYQYCCQAKLCAEYIIPNNNDAQAHRDTEKYKQLLADIEAMDCDDVVIDYYFEASKGIAVPMSMVSDAPLNKSATEFAKKNCDGTFQKAIIANDWETVKDDPKGQYRTLPIACIYTYREKDAMKYIWVRQDWNGSSYSKELKLGEPRGKNMTGDRIRVNLELAPKDYSKEPLVTFSEERIDTESMLPGYEDKTANGDGLDPDEPFIFDKVYAVYKPRFDSNDINYILGFAQMQRLEESIKNDEQREKFKALKAKYDEIRNRELELGNANFASATGNLLDKARKAVWNHNAKGEAGAKAYINAGIAMYNDYAGGSKKGKTTKAELQKFYTTYRAFTKNYPKVKFDRIEFMPDGKQITTFRLSSSGTFNHDIIRRDLGKTLGYLGRIENNGKIFRQTGSGEEYLCQIGPDDAIWDKNDNEIGYIADKKIYINGVLKAEIRDDAYYVGGQLVGKLGSSHFSYADGKRIDLEAITSIYDAFALFLYRIIP